MMMISAHNLLKVPYCQCNSDCCGKCPYCDSYRCDCSGYVTYALQGKPSQPHLFCIKIFQLPSYPYPDSFKGNSNPYSESNTLTLNFHICLYPLLLRGSAGWNTGALCDHSTLISVLLHPSPVALQPVQNYSLVYYCSLPNALVF